MAVTDPAPAKRWRRAPWIVGCAGLAAALAATLLAPPRPRFLWNASASAPVGLYRIGEAAPLTRGDMVIARVPVEFRLFAARRHYLPANVPLVKRVAAAADDEVCAAGARVMVNGRLVAGPLERAGRRGAGARGGGGGDPGVGEA
ncbi:S26 family signal peptidase, partial [Sphingopyxis sp.]|uniref:S26 family signal peptidase n=1 Tax=Sphingopyxis sp. TaxID=1908224 RepID=UPI00260A9329